MSKIIHIRSPLRISFAGGSTDLKEYYSTSGGFVINAAISLYTHAFVKKLPTKKIVFEDLDKKNKTEISFNKIDHLSNQFLLQKSIYLYFIKNFNNNNFIGISILTSSDVPQGSGLGGSSSLSVSIIKAFAKVLNIYLTKKSLIDIAQYIERVVCNFSGGYQDYYPAVYGGINSIEFKKNGNVKLEPIHLSTEQTKNLESSMILLYTNLNRDSSSIIDGISKNISRNKNYFDKIKNEAKMLYKMIHKLDHKFLGSLMRKSWENKKRTHTLISSKKIDKLINEALSKYCIAAKLSGAGGGGFILFIVEPINKNLAINQLKSLGEIYNFSFVGHTTKTSKIEK